MSALPQTIRVAQESKPLSQIIIESY